MLCHRCLKLLNTPRHISDGIYSHSVPLLLRQNYASSYKRRMEKQEQLKTVVHQYASKNTKKTDRVYVWGQSTTGALGVRSFLKPSKHKHVRRYQFIPYRLDYLEAHKIKPVSLACGYGFTVFVTYDGKRYKLFGCGANTDSQLGYQQQPLDSGNVRDFLIEPVPIDLPLLSPETTKLLKVACGRAHTWVITNQEQIFSFGNNSYGQCGRRIIKDEVYRGSQTINRISFDKKIRQVCCGQDHTLIITCDGQVYSCGLGSNGQTGVGNYDNTETLTKVGGDIEGENITTISSRVDSVLAVSDKGDLFGWGNSEFGQVSFGSKDTTEVNVPRHLPIKNIGKVTKAATASTMCAVLNDQGEVYVWGFGVLGKGPRLDQCHTPEVLPAPLFGRNELNPQQRVVDLCAGYDYFAALTASGDLYMWGKNKTACLGLGNNSDQFFPFKVEVPAEVRQVACGVDHTVVLCKSFA